MVWCGVVRCVRAGFGSLAGDSPALLEEALRLGYRLLDLSRQDGASEEAVGRLLQQHLADPAVPLRSEVFLTSKVWPTHLGYGPTSDEVTKSLIALQTAYVDLYMIHWPV